MTVGYHDIKAGMVFEEIGGKGRTVRVTDPGVYHALVTWTSPRGKTRWLQVFNKHLSDPARWRLVPVQGDE